jgi:hypothetical protein
MMLLLLMMLLIIQPTLPLCLEQHLNHFFERVVIIPVLLLLRPSEVKKVIKLVEVIANGWRHTKETRVVNSKYLLLRGRKATQVDPLHNTVT